MAQVPDERVRTGRIARERGRGSLVAVKAAAVGGAAVLETEDHPSIGADRDCTGPGTPPGVPNSVAAQADRREHAVELI